MGSVLLSLSAFLFSVISFLTKIRGDPYSSPRSATEFAPSHFCLFFSTPIVYRVNMKPGRK